MRRALVNVEMEFAKVIRTAERFAKELDRRGIPYAIVGGLAVYQHGYPRTTDDVVVLVTPEGLKEIHASLGGVGYVPPFQGSKNLRDTETRVAIEFLVTGGFPGDGRPKPVAFPAPEAHSLEIGGIRFVDLKTLIELKLAAGMTAPYRQLQDFADVQNLVRENRLPREYADTLSPYVRDKYLELWPLSQMTPPQG